MDVLSNWDAASFFKSLTEKNLLAKSNNFCFRQVSSLEGFEEALRSATAKTAFVCVSDSSAGIIQLNNTPRTRRVKTVFMAMRHKVEDMDARKKCLGIMQEIFRQFLSVLIRENVKLQEKKIYLDPAISFQEIDKYFFTGAACAYFQLSVDRYTDLRFNDSEWESNPMM